MRSSITAPEYCSSKWLALVRRSLSLLVWAVRTVREASAGLGAINNGQISVLEDDLS